MDRWQAVEAIFPHMVELRRSLHRHPELAFEEIETARIVMAELQRLGVPCEYTGPGGGVVGRILGDEEGPVVALRAEMDALPTDEKTELPFASENPGCMHACGHDAHMAMLLGAAALLKADPPPGEVRFVFQPAEEQGGGARVILDSGALTGVQAIFGGHVTHHHATGEIMVKDGIVTAQSDVFRVRITGSGGHGARPHEATDAVVILGMLITALQTLVSRSANPIHPTVVTVGRAAAGSAANVIAEDGIMEGTVRTTDREVRGHVLEGLRRMAGAMAELHGARIDLELEEGYPPLVNTPRETSIARRAALAIVGEQATFEDEHPTLGAEDFSYYLEQLPGAYVRLGALKKGDPPKALHSPEFSIDEEVLKYGALWFEEVARETMRDLRGKA
ncbi:M20 metallopeptidase family protein [Thiohalomonas denitrificans]|uniref:M20 metallopeptidase family protein n=1 Tax=Thiohalomonas denitrificans TaxID=415747 RepID=UPI0026E94286|nr:amidohydrolase [Thiohalomonas denitrificans]